MEIAFELGNLLSFVNDLTASFGLNIGEILGAGSSGAPVTPDLPTQ